MSLLCELTMLTDMVGSRSALVQTAAIHTLPKTHTHTYSHTKVHVHIEPARPIPLLKTIPTVFVNWYTLMLLNAEQTYNYSHKTHTHTHRVHAHKQGRKLSSKHETTEKLNRFLSVALQTP